MGDGKPRFLGLRVVEEAAEETPSRLGRVLLRVKRELPGKWVDVYGNDHRSHVQDLVARVRGTSKNRVAGIVDRTGWDAQLVDSAQEAEDAGRELAVGEPLWVLRVRWSPPEAVPDRAQVVFDELRDGKKP